MITLNEFNEISNCKGFVFMCALKNAKNPISMYYNVIRLS